MSVHGSSITTVSPDKDHISCKDFKDKISETSITVDEITQEPDNPSKKAKEDSGIDEKT